MNSPYNPSSAPRPGIGYVCSCCQRPWDECVTYLSGPGGGRDRQRTCRECHDHGATTMQANRVHIGLWQALVRKQRATVARLKEQIGDLEQQLRDRPEKIVERYIGQDKLEEAQEEARRAFRSRENAWHALCAVRLIHREGQPGQCRCGEPLDRCKTAQIVNHYPGLDKWEDEQVRRKRRGLSFDLPDGHPALLDPRWSRENTWDDDDDPDESSIT